MTVHLRIAVHFVGIRRHVTKPVGYFRVRDVIRVESRIDAEERSSTKSKRNTKEVVSDQAATVLSPKSRARVLPHQYGNLRRLEPRQKIAVQVRVPAELTPTHLTHVIPTGVL
jgi:hypothetical protein